MLLYERVLSQEVIVGRMWMRSNEFNVWLRRTQLNWVEFKFYLNMRSNKQINMFQHVMKQSLVVGCYDSDVLSLPARFCFALLRSFEDIHPRWCLLDRVRALPAPEPVGHCVAAQEAQAQAEAEDHQPEQRGSAPDSSGPALRALS